MRKRRRQLVVTFSGTHEAMEFEAKAGIPGRLIPLPEEISAGCGLAWKTEEEYMDRIKQEAEGRYEAMYLLNLF